MTTTKKRIWDLDREMSPTQLRRTLADLELSKAACARFLGCSSRTVSRYVNGLTDIDPSHAMLLRAFTDSNMLPNVPKWQPRLR